MSRRIMQLALAALTLSLATLGTARAAEPVFVVHYFDELRPLTLDPTRIAVFARESARAADLSAAFARAGLDPERVDALPIPGWSLVAPASDALDAASIEALVARAPGEDAIGFASPVFVGDDGGPLVVTPMLLVGFERAVPAHRAEQVLAAFAGGTVVDPDWGGMPGAYRVASRSANGFEVLAAANALAVQPEVLYAEPDMIFTGAGDYLPNDPELGLLWGISQNPVFGPDMDGPEAWDTTFGSDTVEVVIIDVGVQQDHPDLTQIPGTDVTIDGGDGGPVNACDDHGTPVAGCVSATIDNGLGVVGIAPGTRSASVRTFISNSPCNGSWTTSISWTVDALAWAESIGAEVTNNSNGYGFSSASIAAKYEQTRAGGMTHFASAGNNGSNTIGYPANLTDVNAVAAITSDGTKAGFSQYGVGLAFAAPGEFIRTTDRTGTAGYGGGDTATVQGTSFASPYAAGVAALVYSAKGPWTNAAVEAILQGSTVDLGTAGYDTTFGWGLVNAAQAIDGLVFPFIFANGFEDGTADAWTESVGLPEL